MPSRRIRQLTEKARTAQLARSGSCNADLADGDLDRFLKTTAAASALLGKAVDRLRLSARAMRRIQRVARTIADLAGAERVDVAEIGEAVGYREESIDD